MLTIAFLIVGVLLLAVAGFLAFGAVGALVVLGVGSIVAGLDLAS